MMFKFQGLDGLRFQSELPFSKKKKKLKKWKWITKIEMTSSCKKILNPITLKNYLCPKTW